MAGIVAPDFSHRVIAHAASILAPPRPPQWGSPRSARPNIQGDVFGAFWNWLPSDGRTHPMPKQIPQSSWRPKTSTLPLPVHVSQVEAARGLVGRRLASPANVRRLRLGPEPHRAGFGLRVSSGEERSLRALASVAADPRAAHFAGRAHHAAPPAVEGVALRRRAVSVAAAPARRLRRRAAAAATAVQARNSRVAGHAGVAVHRVRLGVHASVDATFVVRRREGPTIARVGPQGR